MKSDYRRNRSGELPTFKDNDVESSKTSVDLDLEFEASGVECYSFRVTSPDCAEIFADSKHYDNRSNRSFLARAYKRSHRRQNHIVIMYNGLDETIYATPDQLFSFYDELGLRLAATGKLAIFLPTPYHMNRALCYADANDAEKLKKRRGEDFIRMHVPSEALTHEPWRMYANPFQGSKETFELCRFFLGDRVKEVFPGLTFRRIVPERTAAAVRSWATRSPAISLLGYSLGGLRALTEFLFDRKLAKRDKRPPLFSSCVAVSSGGSLDKLGPPHWIDKKKWERMISDLVEHRADIHFQSAQKKFPHDGAFAEEYFRTLKDIFLGDARIMRSLEDDARKAGRSMLFLLGGADELVPPESVHRINPEGGVNILQVSGLSHLFAYDVAWNTSKGLICDVIAQFLDNVTALDMLPDPKALIEFLVLLDLSLGLLPYKERIDTDVLRGTAQGLPRAPDDVEVLGRVLGKALAKDLEQELGIAPELARKLFRDFLVEQFDDLALQLRRKVVNPALFWPEWEKHFLGGLLQGNYMLKRKVSELEGENRELRLDEAMVRTGLLTTPFRDELVREQEKRLEPIRQRLREMYSGYVRAHGSGERPETGASTEPANHTPTRSGRK